MNSKVNNERGKIFRLQGLSFKEELSGQKIDFEENTIYLGLVPWECCNWSCKYCHQNKEQSCQGNLKTAEILRLLEEANDAGIRSLLLLGGEVLLKNTWAITSKIVQKAYDCNLISVIYTNASQLSSDMLSWLADRNVSLAIKVDSLDENKYDRLTQIKGSFRNTMNVLELAKRTSMGNVVYENNKEKLVRLLFTTVGNSWNVDEYISIARFATNHEARWMMESLNHRGNVYNNPELSISEAKHSEAMKITMALNPEQQYTFSKPCRLLSCVTVRNRGELAICPQDYTFIGNIRSCRNFSSAIELVKERVQQKSYRENWLGTCPIKESQLTFS